MIYTQYLFDDNIAFIIYTTLLDKYQVKNRNIAF